MKLLSMALVIGASLLTFNSYSQVSIRIGRVAPPPRPVVVYESRYPAPRPVYHERSRVVVVEPRRDYGYSRRDQDWRHRNDRYDDSHRDNRRDNDRGYETRDHQRY